MPETRATRARLRPAFQVALTERVRAGEALMRALCHGESAADEVPGLWRALTASEAQLVTYRRGLLTLEDVYAAEDAAFHTPGSDPTACPWCRRAAAEVADPISLPPQLCAVNGTDRLGGAA